VTDLRTPVDSATTSLNQLRHLMAADDVEGARRLFYAGDLDWLSERLTAEDLRTMRSKVNSGDLQWLRDRFLSADIAWVHDVVARGDLDALRTAARIGGLGWLQALVPAGDYRQIGRRLTDGDLPWLRARVARWDLPRVLSPGIVAATPAGTSTAAPGSPAPGAAAATAGAAVVGATTGGVAGNGSTATRHAPVPPGGTVLRTPQPTAPPSRRQRLARTRRRFAWVGWVAVAALAVVAWTRLGNRDERPTLDTTPGTTALAVTTAAPRVTGVAPGGATPATTAAPATTAPPPTTAAAPTTVPPLPATRSIFFAYNSSSLPPEAAAVIAEVVADTARLSDVKVQFVGVTDGRGNATANRTLALRRAQVVLDAVKAAGYNGPTETSFGGVDATASADKARRVDIVFVRV
jgi:outer membrane protein OmpA-like peptidoglycan-associated protein